MAIRHQPAGSPTGGQFISGDATRDEADSIVLSGDSQPEMTDSAIDKASEKYSAALGQPRVVVRSVISDLVETSPAFAHIREPHSFDQDQVDYIIEKGYMDYMVQASSRAKDNYVIQQRQRAEQMEKLKRDSEMTESRLREIEQTLEKLRKL